MERGQCADDEQKCQLFQVENHGAYEGKVLSDRDGGGGAYAAFGFKAAGLSADARVFPNTDGKDDADKIWADVPLKPDSSEGAGGYLIPLCYNKSFSSNPIHLYYLPNNKTGNPSYFITSADRDNGQILAENMFYSTVLRDPESIYTPAHGPLLTA